MAPDKASASTAERSRYSVASSRVCARPHAQYRRLRNFGPSSFRYFSASIASGFDCFHVPAVQTRQRGQCPASRPRSDKKRLESCSSRVAPAHIRQSAASAAAIDRTSSPDGNVEADVTLSQRTRSRCPTVDGSNAAFKE